MTFFLVLPVLAFAQDKKQKACRVAGGVLYMRGGWVNSAFFFWRVSVMMMMVVVVSY